MISEESNVNCKNLKRVKPKRAEMQIYRPGAMRLLKKAAEKSNENDKCIVDKINDTSKPNVVPPTIHKHRNIIPYADNNEASSENQKNSQSKPNIDQLTKSRVFHQTNRPRYHKEMKDNVINKMSSVKHKPHNRPNEQKREGEIKSDFEQISHSKRSPNSNEIDHYHVLDGNSTNSSIINTPKDQSIKNKKLKYRGHKYQSSKESPETLPKNKYNITKQICDNKTTVSRTTVSANSLQKLADAPKLLPVSTTVKDLTPNKDSKKYLKKIFHSDRSNNTETEHSTDLPLKRSRDKELGLPVSVFTNKIGQNGRIKNKEEISKSGKSLIVGHDKPDHIFVDNEKKCSKFDKNSNASSINDDNGSSKMVELSPKNERNKKSSNRVVDVDKLINDINLSFEDTSKSDTSDESHHYISEPSFVKSHELSFYNKDESKVVKPVLKQKIVKYISWGDEKWSPAQRQTRECIKEEFQLDSPSQRGIISISKPPLTSSLESYDSENYLGKTSTSKVKKLLFNPNNPSKPVPVIPSARDLPPTGACQGYGNSEFQAEEDCPNFEISVIDSAPSGSGGKVDPSIFYSIQKGELDVNYYVSSNQLPQEFRRIMDIREHLKKCYRHLLLTDIRLCQEKNIENALWKSLYYVIIEKLREYITREPPLKDRSQSTMLIIIDEGLEYLQSLLNDLQAAYKFSLSTHCEDITMYTGVKNRVRLALFSCQKILLCMGDLARYREQHSQLPNYNSAKRWYEKALEVHPRNGRPFNQLAIIAVSQKRPLDVVYYYIRSLAATNPFTSARDSLITMFEDIRRKYNAMEKLASCVSDCTKVTAEEGRRSLSYREESLRREIWIRPDSGVTNKRTLSQSEEQQDNDLEELKNLSQDQLMKNFLTSYLHCHGMLFAKVGLDHFMEVLVGTLKLFQFLLTLSPQRLSSTHLLQIMATNMFAVDNTQLRDTRLENGLRSAAQDFALLLAQEMFGRLTEAMVQLFPQNLHCGDKVLEGSHISGNACGLFLPRLAHFVPAVKVWCDWLLYNSSVWNPPPVSHENMGLDSWAAVGELATLVKGLGPPDISIDENDHPSSGSVPVSLPEDSFLRGYSPLISAQRSHYFVPPGSSMDRARDWVRLNKLQLCLNQFLCGVQPPVLRLQKTDRGDILVPIVAITPPDSPSDNRALTSETDDSEESFSSSESEEDVEVPELEDTVAPLASAVRLLASRKKMLEKKQRQQRKLQSLVEGSVTLEMRICPRYLVPDTNCFIEHLSIIQALENKKSYNIMVPLIVLRELHGLSRDADVEKYQDAHHAIKVREGAANAFHYITASKHQQLKCVTSKGSVLPSAFLFTAEVDDFKDLTNDDKILSCCLHLCNDTNKRRSIQDGVRRLRREVVLLTQDRNLRVKAYARDVPVMNLLDFSHWAGIK